jgi:hypothetical protein
MYNEYILKDIANGKSLVYIHTFAFLCFEIFQQWIVLRLWDRRHFCISLHCSKSITQNVSVVWYQIDQVIFCRYF